MPYFYVNKNKQPNGDNEVHQSWACSHAPNEENRERLGEHVTCRGAVQEAKRRGYTANGCYYCANACHTK